MLQPRYSCAPPYDRVSSMLQAAIRRGNIPEVKRLLEKRPQSLHLPDGQHGRTPLMHAAAQGNLEMVRLLLELGAGVDVVVNGKTALYYGCHGEGSTAVVAQLLESGADVTRASVTGFSSLLHMCLRRNQAGAVMLLLSHCSSEERLEGLADQSCLTVLWWACREGHHTVVKYMLESGADPAVPDTHGRTPLSMAVGRGDGACIAALQMWEASYWLVKARRTRDVVTSIQHRFAADMDEGSGGAMQRIPVFLGMRVVGEGGCGHAERLPGVEVRMPAEDDVGESALGVKGGAGRSLDEEEDADREKAEKEYRKVREVRCLVLAFALEQMKTELFVEVMEALGNGSYTP